MNRRRFLEWLTLASAVATVPALPKMAEIAGYSPPVEARLWGHVACPVCGLPMPYVDAERRFIACCGRTYTAPTIRLERIE